MNKSLNIKLICRLMPFRCNQTACYSTFIRQKKKSKCQNLLQTDTASHNITSVLVALKPDMKYCPEKKFCNVAETSTCVSLNEDTSTRIKELETKNKTLISEIINDFKNLINQGNTENKIQDFVEKSTALRSKLLHLATKENSRTTMIDNLNSLLYCYHTCNLSKEFNETFSLMEAKNVLNEATFSVYARQKVKTECWRSGVQVIEQMKENGYPPHSRTYHSIILKSIEMGDWDDALKLFQEMKALEIVFSDDFYSAVINLVMEKKNSNRDLMFEILSLLKDTGFILGPKSFNQAKNWFLRDRRWSTRVSSIDPSGTCKTCGSTLKNLKLPNEIRTNLQHSLFKVAETAIVNAEKASNRHQLKDFHDVFIERRHGCRISRLKQLIDLNGPYDVVLDVLNIAYFKNKGFNSFQVKRVAQHFLEKGFKVLVMCSSPLFSHLLQKAPDPKQQHLVDLLLFFRRQKCGIFFVDDERRDGQIDDYFLLLSIIFHNMRINIVTGDNFFDHVHSFDLITRRHFGRWKRTHKIAFKRFTKQGRPVFAPMVTYDIDVQSTENSWHIPGDKGKWLCCTKR